MSVTVGTRGLLIGDREVPVYSGAMHYWRLERELWPRILDRVQELGFGMLETYIPWSVHETAPGELDWGERDERKDVEAFIRLCEERGLWLLARPGPHINAEMTDFGFPEWVVLDPQVQARTALDSLHLDAAWGLHPPRQFPVPSYASERFYAYVAMWYDAVCPIIARHLAPEGCVVAVQSDNETCYLFHDRAFATDYHADSLRLYRSFLSELYGDVDALNATYGSEFPAFDAVQPPRDGDVDTRTDLPWRIDWVAYKEFQVRWSVARMARMLRERGLGAVPIFHDVAYQLRTPIDIGRMEADPDIDWVGLNLYRPPEEYRPLVDRARFLAGSTRLPFVPELGAGLWSHHARTALPGEEEFATLSALMHGIKAFNFYMLVERERWQGSPITRHGEMRPEYARYYADLMAFLERVAFWRFSREPQVLVLLGYDLARFAAATSALDYGHADLLRIPWALFEGAPDLGFRWDVAREAHLRDDCWPRRVMAALQARSIDYDLSDTHISLERLRRYPLVFVQAADFMDVDDQQRLLEFAAAGGQVVFGPGVPYLDQHLRPAAVVGERLTWAPDGEVERWIEQLAPRPEFSLEDSRLEVVAHRFETRTLLFVANPTPDPLATRLRFEGNRRFSSEWLGRGTSDATDELEVELAPYKVEIFEVHA